MDIEQEIKEIKERLSEHEKRLNAYGAQKTTKKASTNKGKSIMELFEQLKTEKFFKEKRKPNQILDKLSQKGYTYRGVRSLTEPLQRATKQEILQREKTEDGWVYFE